MAVKYHISPTTGNANKCQATTRACPVGGASDHFSTKEEARRHFEDVQSSESLAPVARMKPAAEVAKERAEKSPWSIPCPNPECNAYSHDLPNLAAIRTCLSSAKTSMAEDEYETYRRSWMEASKELVENQRRECTELIEAYNALPGEARTEYYLLTTLQSLAEDETPQWYTRDTDRMRKLLKRARANPRSRPAQRIEYATPEEINQKHLDKLNEEDMYAITEEKFDYKPLKASTAQRFSPKSTVPPQQLLQQSSLAELHAWRVAEEELSKPEPREQRRRFRRRQAESAPIVYTENYMAYNDFIGSLPPKTLKVYSLYENAREDARLNRPEVLALLETKFKEAKAEEADLFVKPVSALEEIESLLSE